MLRFKQFLVEGISKNLPIIPNSTKTWEDFARRYSRGDLDLNPSTNPFLYYTGSAYTQYNEFLRDPDGYASKPNFSKFPDTIPKDVDDLTSHFNKHAITLDKPLTVYRGISVDPDYWEDILQKSREGRYFIDPAFMSTTLNKYMIPKHLRGSMHSRTVPKILQINIPANTRFLPNTVELPFIRGENELILGRDTPLEIKPSDRSTFFPRTTYSKNVDIHQANVMPSVESNISKNWPKLLRPMSKLAKAIPVVGTAASVAAMAQRAQAGDYVGAGLEAASEIADYIPAVGTAASLGIQGYLADRDMPEEEKKKNNQIRANQNLRTIAQSMKQNF